MEGVQVPGGQTVLVLGTRDRGLGYCQKALRETIKHSLLTKTPAPDPFLLLPVFLLSSHFYMYNYT